MTNNTESRGQKTVLIVEDQALMRQTLRDFLQDAFPDCSFLDAADGERALVACKAYRPVLVLMDKCLPDADGIELTALLKKLYPAIQVIVMSYRSGEIYVQRSRPRRALIWSRTTCSPSSFRRSRPPSALHQRRIGRASQWKTWLP